MCLVSYSADEAGAQICAPMIPRGRDWPKRGNAESSRTRSGSQGLHNIMTSMLDLLRSGVPARNAYPYVVMWTDK